MDLADLIAGIDPDALDTADEGLIRELEAAIRAEEHSRLYGHFKNMFPDTGEHRRELYPKHLEFFAAGAVHQERCFMAANRIGKTEAGSFESTAHLTGDYPHWWEGYRFTRSIRMWAAGDTNETTRDVIQKKLLGSVEWYGDKKGVTGTGMIPHEAIVQDSITWKAGVPDLIDHLEIKHKLGGTSRLGLKSYFQGRRAFQGTEQDLIWCDEEPDEDVYNEMLIRLMTTRGLAMLTFTPLSGLSKVVESFLPAELRPLS